MFSAWFGTYLFFLSANSLLGGTAKDMVLGQNSSHLEDEFAHGTIMRDCNKL